MPPAMPTFPSWTTMLTIDVCMALLAAGATLIAILRWPLLSRAKAMLGVGFILGGFWLLASLYIYDFYTMTVLPHFVGMERAMAEMRHIHGGYSWYVHLASAALIVAGLWESSRRLDMLDGKLQAAKREAEDQSRQKGQFLASMSHEFRTPLNAILGYAEFMQLDPIAGQKEKCKEYAGHIHSSGEMLRDLISDLLDLSRIEEGRIELCREATDLGPVIEDCVTRARAVLSGDHAEISLTVAPELRPIRLDRRAMEQVALNLLSNSAKHTPADGRIDVTVRPGSADGVTLIVEDTGSGIPAEILDDIFDPYVCGDPYVQDGERGYGLGLSICKRLIDAHHGTIAIDSAPGKGTTVTVTLPDGSGRPRATAAAAA